MTVTSSLAVSSPSLAVKRSTYVPATLNWAVVAADCASANVTVPGPLTWLHVTVSVPGGGRPSSVTVPPSVAALGSVMVWSGPALTVGGVFGGTSQESGTPLPSASGVPTHVS